MRRLIVFLPLALMLVPILIGTGCTIDPAVRNGNALEQKALENGAANLDTWSTAILADLKINMDKPVLAVFAHNVALITDAQGKVPLDKYIAEVKARDDALTANAAKIAELQGKYSYYMTDVRNSIKVNEAIGKYFNRKMATAADIEAILKEIVNIATNAPASPAP